MKKEAVYFNFGLLLVSIVIVFHFFTLLIIKLASEDLSGVTSSVMPSVTVIGLAFLWYRLNKSFLKFEQYFIAIMPLLTYLALRLAFATMTTISIGDISVLIILFFSGYASLMYFIMRLKTKLGDKMNEANLFRKSFFYLLSLFLIILASASIAQII